MGRLVIAAYQPKPGMETRVVELVRGHVPLLRQLGLATDRPVQVMRSATGVVVEVFEWTSTEAIAAAHDIPAVQALWEQFAIACDHVPLSVVAECQSLFAEFSPVSL